MITGAVSFTYSVESHLFSFDVLASDGISFNPVSQRGLKGGYYSHTRLPHLPEDRFYSDSARDILVLLSGSVYNRKELADNLRISKLPTDPELIADLFHRDGPGFVETLNGDFAIFILMSEKRQAWLFRDHLGICPMAWTLKKETLFFSSDINGLCRSFEDGRRIEREYLLEYFKYIDYRKTPDERITKLRPGHFLHFSEGTVRIEKYWEPERIRTARQFSYDKMLSDLQELLYDSVRIRSDGRFTAGAHVSSGIDSGVASSLARKEYLQQKDFFGFSWSPAGDVPVKFSHDERELVVKSCEIAGIRPVFSEMNEAKLLRYVSDYYNNHLYLSEDEVTDRASELNVNLIFSGFGGDEFISIGHSGIDLDLLRGLKLRTFFRRNPLTRPGRFVRRFLFYVLDPLLGILDKHSRKAFREDARYLKKSFRKNDREAIRNFYFHRSRRQMHLNVIRFYNIPSRCESWHVMGFRKGIEYRYPLLDKRIVEYMLKVPSEMLCKTEHFRPLLREIGKGLIPEEVRLNESKNDPVYLAWMDWLYKNVGTALMEEADTWRANPDLDFIDFELLTDSVSRYKARHLEDDKVLFRTLIRLKALNEFTVDYRTKNLS